MAGNRRNRFVIGIVGGLGLVAGIAMIVLPGPAVLVIPVSLAILATEFDWAQRLLGRVTKWIARKTMKQ